MSPKSKTEDDLRWLILREKVSEESIKAAFRLFRENGIEPILIKGWAAAREYPASYQRRFNDIDLCVAPEDFEKSLGIISGVEGNKLNIDLHKGLRHLDKVKWERLFLNSEIVRLDDVGVRILRAEDHLRILCVHWLTDGGADKEKLLDIYYLLENSAEKFDWNYCFEAIDKNRRDWIVKTVALVERFYKSDAAKLPFRAELGSVPEWFLRALEKEWASDTKLLDIHAISQNREELWRQLKKRFRPNPIQATVLMEGKFNEAPRFYYQIGSFFIRLKPSVGKAIRKIKYKLRKSESNE